MGGSIAYHLARAKRRVLVVERDDVAAAPSASWASGGGIRRQGRHRAEAALAIEAIARWPRLEEELGADLHYRQGGGLFVAESDDEAERVARFVERQHAAGLTDVRLLDRLEIRAIVPGIAEQVVAGSYSPADGHADPALTAHAFAEAARSAGAAYWTGTPCEALRTRGERVAGVRTARGDVEADTVVLAAGAWSDELARAIGLRLPIRTAVYQMLRSTPAPDGLLAPVLSAIGRALSLKQLPDGAFLLGGGWPGEATPDRRGYAVLESSVAFNWETACAVLPAVARQRVDRAWCGLEAHSIDDVPFIGPVPGIDGLVLALGFSGHGFAIAPAVGRAVADAIAGRPVPELDMLAPARMARFDAAEVTAFLDAARA